MPMLVSAGSMSTAATSPRASAASSAGTSLNGTTTVVCVERHGRADVAAPRRPRRRRRRGSRRPRRRCRGSSGRCTRILRPAGHLARVADEAAVGVGRRERELPARHAEALGQQSRRRPRHPRSGSMKVEPLASCSEIARTDAAGACPHIAPVSPRHRSTWSMPSTHAKCAPDAALDVDRPRARPLRHPQHRHAVGHVRHGLAPTAPRSADALARNSCELVLPERRRAVARSVVQRHSDSGEPLAPRRRARSAR